ncbi:hypothetical protein LCGC14_0581570 [marine sediment metagenome]|uniref:Uncharacterized protein n=1 Tax=marine sediment metagenome TaxID=412755 RepID=A0A0F9RZV0_9ZZZZ
MPTVEEVQEKYGAIKAVDIVANGDPITFATSVEGLEGTGKTYFGLLTCPTPIVHVNFGDRDATPLLYDMSAERRERTVLYAFHAKGSGGWTRPEGKDALHALAEVAQEHLSDGKLAGGTFIIDSGSTFWDVVQEVYVAPEQEKREREGGKKRGGLEYGQANLIVSGVLNWIKNQGAFLIITHTKAQEWDAQGPIPGKYRAKQNNKVPYIVEVRLDLTKECSTCSAPDCRAHVGRKHFGQFLKFGRDTALEGMKLESPTFEMVYSFYARGKFPNEEALR